MMTENAYRWCSLALTGLVLLATLWIQMEVADLSGKVDVLTEMLTAHLNAPGLHPAD